MTRGLLLPLIFFATGLDFNLPADPPKPVRYQVGQRHEICPGATHFYADWAKPPSWARDMRVVCHIGQHIFLAPKARHHRGHVAAKD